MALGIARTAVAAIASFPEACIAAVFTLNGRILFAGRGATALICGCAGWTLSRRGSAIEVAPPQTGRFAAMYTLRPISVYLGSILSILVLCASSAVVKAEEKPEIVRGPGAEKAQPPPKPAIARCGNLINGYVKAYQCCCTYWNGYNNRYCIVSKPRNSDGSSQACPVVCRNTPPCG
jgi:hypothetical protein